MSANYAKLISSTMEYLPEEKQVEVYDFANYLCQKVSKTHSTVKSKKSLLDLEGVVKSNLADLSINHDKYLYD